MICYLYSNPIYLLYSSDVPALLYYAQVPATIIALLLGFYIFLNGSKIILNRLLFLISVLFALWTFTTLIAWAGNNGGLMVFIWPFYNLILSFIAIFCIYFIYVFLEKKDVGSRLKIIFLVLLAPILILAPTYFNISGFNITNCDAFDFESLPLKVYTTSLGILAIIWILILLIRKYRISDSGFKKQIILMGTGIELFIFSFFGMEFGATYLVRIGILPDSQFELYGLFGMVIFMIYISILIVRFKAFNGRLFATQVLVWGLVILIGSEFLFIKVPINFVLTGITFIGAIVFGFNIIKSVKKEIQQKEHLEKLSDLLTQSKNRLEETNMKLEDSNDRLKTLDKLKTEFLSLASHQLRSPLTAIKGYTSMLLEGDFGEIGVKQKEAIDRVYQSSKHLTVVVEDLLNVAKIEQGGMVYTMKPFDLEKITSDIVGDMTVVAKEHGLKLTFKTDKKGPYKTNGDMEKLRQVIMNFVDNSIKYTKKGSIEVKLVKDEEDKKIIFSVKDTGMGISPEIKGTLFAKFARGDGGKMDATGSGLGLYLAKEVVEGHKGRIWAESKGVGEGSTFSMELNSMI